MPFRDWMVIVYISTLVLLLALLSLLATTVMALALSMIEGVLVE